MRKSKMSSTMGVVGGAPIEQAIVPPAAAAAAHAILPENNPVLQRLLSDDELSAIKEQRMMDSPPRHRQHNHREQVERDLRRANIDKANQRRKREAKSVASRKNGEAFRLGKAQPLTPQEEAELLGEELRFSDPPTSQELGNLEDALNKTVDEELAQQIEAAKPRNMSRLPTNPVGEVGGASLVSNTLGANPRATAPTARIRRAIPPVPVQVEQPPLDNTSSGSAQKTRRTQSKKTTKKASTK